MFVSITISALLLCQEDKWFVSEILLCFIKLYFLKATLSWILVLHGRCLISSTNIWLIFATILKTEKTVSNNLFRTAANRCHSITPNFSLLMPEHLGMKETASSSMKDSWWKRASVILSKFSNQSYLVGYFSISKFQFLLSLKSYLLD